MPDEQIARRSVAFLEIKSSVNFVAVAVVGALMALGVLGPHRSLLLTALPAALSVAFLGAVAALWRLGPGEDPGDDASRARRWMHAAREAVGTGTGAALELCAAPIGASSLARSATGRSTTPCCGRRSRRSAPTCR